MPGIVHTEPVSASNLDAVSRLSVWREQLAYVSPVTEMLAGIEDRPGSVGYAVLAGDTPVGFFILVFDRDAISHYACSRKSCGIEGFFIDGERQGRGYGSAAAASLRDLVKSEFPDRDTLDLTVNCRNEGAIRTYLDAGFEDTGRLYHGGRSGPQHILSMTLRSGRKDIRCLSMP